MEQRKFEERREPEIVYSRSVKAGKRIYYLDVKKARNEDLYLCITESKKKSGMEDEPMFEKHKVFLYKEDFKHFTEALGDVIGFVEQRFGTIEEREEWTPEADTKENVVAADAADESVAATAEDNTDGQAKRLGFFSRLTGK